MKTKTIIWGTVKILFAVAAVLYFLVRCAGIEQRRQADMDHLSRMMSHYDKKAQWIQTITPRINADETHLIRTLDVSYELCERYGIPKDVFLAVIYEESRFNPRAVSDTGAIGLCQIMPATGFLIARAYNLPVESTDDLYKIENNITVAVLFLNDLIRRYGLRRALAFYYDGRGGMSERGQKYADAVLRRSKIYADAEVQN